MITALPDFKFVVDASQSRADNIVIMSQDNNAPIVIELLHSEMFMSANVIVQSQNESQAANFNIKDGRFYETWEALIQSGIEAAVSGGDEWQKAVALIGLFESEMMNGGVGQYLSNSDGQYLNETWRWLDQIGAIESARILMAAVALRVPGQSYDALWEERSVELGQLDDAYLAANEGLASLTIKYFGK